MKNIKKKKPNNINDVLFQVSDWDFYHEEIDLDEETLKKYVIRLYGTTNDNKKIFVKVNNYTPYFFVEIPKDWKKQKVQVLVNMVKDEVAKKNSDLVNSLVSWDI